MADSTLQGCNQCSTEENFVAAHVKDSGLLLCLPCSMKDAKYVASQGKLMCDARFPKCNQCGGDAGKLLNNKLHICIPCYERIKPWKTE